MKVETAAEAMKNDLENIVGLKEYCGRHSTCDGCIYEGICSESLNCSLDTFMWEILERTKEYLKVE